MLRRRKLASGKPGPVFPDSIGGWRDPSNTSRDLCNARGSAKFAWVISRSSEPSTVKHEDDHKTLVLTPRKSRATACQRRDDPIPLEVLMRHCI
jgi:hypothetical protein